MATARYDNAYQGWILEYTDESRKGSGQNAYRKKKIRDKEYPKLPARQKKIKEAEMLAKAVEIEEATKKGRLCVKDPNKPILATDYLEQMTTLTARSKKEEAIKERKRIVGEFVTWLRGHRHYKKCYLHEINRLVAGEWLETYLGSAARTVEKRRKAMATIWKLIIEDLEDIGSTLPIHNPWTGTRLMQRIKVDKGELEKEGRVKEVEHKPFTMEQVREIIAILNYDKPLIAAIWRVGFLTGWRVGDIVGMKWEQLDFTKRTLTNVSKKTEIKTIIYLTDKLLAMFLDIREKCPDTSPKARVFAHRGLANYKYQNRKVIDSIGLTETQRSGVKDVPCYTFHSLRGTIKTALKVKDYNQSRLDYLVGHRGKGVDSKHYDKFYHDPKAATADILEYLEGVLDEATPEGVIYDNE